MAVSSIRGVVEAAIQRASNATGVDFGFLMGAAKRESGGNPAANAATSSASGLFQFIDQTWLSTLKQHGAKYGYARYADLITQGSDGRYSVNGDGSTTEFDLASLKTIRRIRFGNDADAGSFEPVTGQLMFTMGDSGKVAFMDARSGKLVATLPLPSHHIEASAPDGAGNLFVAERDRDEVVRIDARTHKATAHWSTAPCHQPTGLDYDAATRRIFVGCRGDQPLLAVLDADTGAVVAKLPIGRGNDGVSFDPATHRIYASNGLDADLMVIDQSGADRYRLEQAVTTRPMARTMALDPQRNRVYLVAAEGGVDPAMKVDTAVAPFYPNFYFDNSFTVLTYQEN